MKNFILLLMVLVNISVSFAGEKFVENGGGSCGVVLEGEFSQPVEAHKYTVTLSPGDTLAVKVIPVGEYLATYLEIKEPFGGKIESKKAHPPGHINIKTKPLSGRGDYEVILRNHALNMHSRGGMYSIFFTCVLHNGKTLAP